MMMHVDISIEHQALWHQKTRVSGLFIIRRDFRDSMFSRFNGTPTCDGQPDGRTDMVIAYTALV